MGDDGAQALVMLGPVVEDRPAVEMDGVGHLPRLRGIALLRQADPRKQAEQIEGALGPELLQHVVLGELGDVDDEVGAELAEILGQAVIGRLRQDLELGAGRRTHAVPVEVLGGLARSGCLNRRNAAHHQIFS